METNFQVEGDGDPEDNGRKSKKDKKKKKEKDKDKEKVGTASNILNSRLREIEPCLQASTVRLCAPCSLHQRVKVADGRTCHTSF